MQNMTNNRTKVYAIDDQADRFTLFGILTRAFTQACKRDPGPISLTHGGTLYECVLPPLSPQELEGFAINLATEVAKGLPPFSRYAKVLASLKYPNFLMIGSPREFGYISPGVFGNNNYENSSRMIEPNIPTL